MKRIMLVLSLFAFAALATAQTDTATPTPTPTPVAVATPTPGFTNVYAGGVTYNPGVGVAGTALYGRRLLDSTFAFTVLDALHVQPTAPLPRIAGQPNPGFMIDTNVSIGVAQKVLTIGGVPIYVPTSAGISWSGNHTGWAWSTGGMAWIPVKKGSEWAIAPQVRLLKSSVSGGAGYGVMGGVLLGWGK